MQNWPQLKNPNLSDWNQTWFMDITQEPSFVENFQCFSNKDIPSVEYRGRMTPLVIIAQ